MIRLSAPNLGDEECKAVERVLRSGQLVHGEECDLFEKELSEYLGVSDVVVVSSGTAALHLSLIALGVGAGDAVLVPDFTFPATVNVVELVGARPVFVDVDISTYNVTCERLEEAIESWKGPERLKAIIPAHEFGCPADMTGMMALAKEHNLLVIEDAACALGATHHGRKVGSFGDTGCFSFHPRKSLTTGEGGAIATNNRAVAAKLRQWRSHGMQSSPQGMQFMVPGFNYRMTNFQAALGRVQLLRLDGWLKERRQLQQIYYQELQRTTLSLP
ncbi:MAG: DegT/DnrJ/EryC1/StrS family aminotransferase, partial [Nitrospiria bacterium]